MALVPGTLAYDQMLLKIKDWKIVYPIYFDKTASRAKGRQVSLEKAIDTPDIDDFIKIFAHLKIHNVVEINKRHPADYFCNGRMRYKLKNDDGTWCNSEIKNSTFSLNFRMGPFRQTLRPHPEVEEQEAKVQKRYCKLQHLSCYGLWQEKETEEN